MVKKIRRWITPAAIAVLACATFQAEGAERTWAATGGSTSGWDVGVNWSSETVPTSSDIAVFTGANKYQPIVNTKAMVQGVVFRSSGWNIRTTEFNALMPGSSGIHNAVANGINTIQANISLSGSQTWTVDTGGTLVSTGTISGNSLTKAGGGTLLLNGINTSSEGTIVGAGTLRVNGSIIGGVEVQSGATLGGSGVVGVISGAGTVGPGNSPGILTTGTLNGSAGTDFHFQFTQAATSGTSAPNFSNATASGNDVLRLTGLNAFTTALGADNVITLDFTEVTLSLGDVFQGGFYSDTGDFMSSISSATFNYLGVEEFEIIVSTSQVFADFAGGNANGYITQFTVIPEPTTAALLALSLGGLWFVARRNKGVKVAA